MKLLRDHVDRYAIATLVEIGERHQNEPLRSAHTEPLRPETAQLLKMLVDGDDQPGKASDDVLILRRNFSQSDTLERCCVTTVQIPIYSLFNKIVKNCGPPPAGASTIIQRVGLVHRLRQALFSAW